MQGFTIGKVQEVQKNNAQIYRLSFYDGFIEREFTDRAKLLDFLARETQALFALKANNIAAIEYRNRDKILHYLVIKDVDGQTVVSEQSKFEYQNVQSFLFRKNINRRVINDRHYDFTDIVRASVNFKTLFTWIKSIILFCVAVLAIVLAIDIIDIYHGSARIPVPVDENTYVALAFVNLLLALSVVFMALLSTYYSVKNSAQANRTNTNFNFRLITRKKQNLRKINLVFQFLFLIIMAAMLVLAKADHVFDSWNSWSILMLTNLVLIVCGFLFEVFYITLIYINLARYFRKYFANLKFKVFKEWYQNGKSHEHVNARPIFLLSNEDSLPIYMMEQENLLKLKKRYTNSEIKAFFRKTQAQIKTAINLRKQDYIKE